MKYEAPWGTSVRWITAGVAALVPVIGAVSPWGGAAVAVLLIAMYVVGPTGYSIEGRDLVVHRRAVSAVRQPLAGLQGVWLAPGAMGWSMRTFGNGGLCGFTGWFYNTRLGRYRAWVTDPSRTVVLEFGDHTVVVSPRRPHLFVDELREKTGVEPRAETPDR